MKCENCFCIYQSDNKCTLDEISLDSSGMCIDCFYVDIAEETLMSAKLKQIKNLK